MPFINKIVQIFSNNLNFFSKRPYNSEIVSRAKQYSGEYSRDLPFSRYYDYYHQWPQVKRNVNSIHKRWMGSSIEVRSQSKQFDQLWKIWSKTTDFIPKLKEMSLDCLITGTGMLEKQYYGSMLSNVEHVPTKTLFRMYRDEFANRLSIWQQNDGDIKQIDPKYIMVMTINNPERDAIGKSALYSLAVPQRVAGKLNDLGEEINAGRYLPSILDTKARLNFAHMEIAEKQAKSRWFISLRNIKDRERQKEIERDLENEATSKYMTVTDGDVDATPIQFNAQVSNERYLNDVDKQINQGTGFPGNVIDETQHGFASSQTPMQDTSMSIEDMQNDLSAVVEFEIFKELCENWGLDFDKVQPELIFNIFVEKLTFEQAIKIPPTAPLADTEIRSVYKEFIPGMNDQEWEDFKQKKDDEKQLIMQQQQATGKTADPQNKRPDIEKEAPKPETTSMENHPMLKNPKAFEKYIKDFIKDSAKEFTQGYFAMPPIDGKPYESPQPEVTKDEMIDDIKYLISLAKNPKLKKEDRDKALEKASKVIASMEAADNQRSKCIAHFVNDGRPQEQAVAICMRDPTANEKSHENCKVKSSEQEKPHRFLSEYGFAKDSDPEKYSSECQQCGAPESDKIHTKSVEVSTPHKFEPSGTEGNNKIRCRICGSMPDDVVHRIESINDN